MTQASRPLLILAFLALFSLPVNALQAAATSSSQQTQELLDEKMSLLQRALANSTTVKRIDRSENHLARERLQRARDQFSVAQQAQQAGQPEAAAEKLELAMQFYASAAGSVADTIDRGDAQRTRYNELSVSIESFRLYVQRAMVKSEDPNPLDANQLNSLMQLAASLRQHDNFGAANDVLNDAYMLTITAVSALKGGTTIVYSQDFDTPEQEYFYELERYKGLMQLFMMVTDDGKLPAKYNWAEKSMKTSRSAYQAAENNAGRAAYPEALEQLSEATKKLTQVLRLLGLPIS